MAEKTYERGLEYSRRAPGTSDPKWRDRLEIQIESACGWLEAHSPSPWLFGGTFTRADLAVAVAMQYLERVVPELESVKRYPQLHEHRQHCEIRKSFTMVGDARNEAIASGWQPEETTASRH